MVFLPTAEEKARGGLENLGTVEGQWLATRSFVVSELALLIEDVKTDMAVGLETVVGSENLRCGFHEPVKASRWFR